MEHGNKRKLQDVVNEGNDNTQNDFEKENDGTPETLNSDRLRAAFFDSLNGNLSLGGFLQVVKDCGSNSTLAFGDMKEIQTNVIDIWGRGDYDQKIGQCVLQELVDLHTRVPERHLNMNKWTTAKTPLHILTHMIRILNYQGFKVREHTLYQLSSEPDYSILDGAGEVRMIVEFEPFPLISADMEEDRTKIKRALNNELRYVLQKLVLKMLRIRCLSGALADCSTAILVEIDLQRFEKRKTENDSDLLPNIPLNYCVVTESDIFPSYLQVFSTWIVRSLREGHVNRSVMERLNLNGFYGVQ